MSDLEDKLLFLDIEGAKALKEGIDKKSLYKDNTIEYTPTSDYNPAPKKYVDDAANAIPRIEVSETEPTEEKVHLWINPDSKDDISIPEIKDSEISTEDTWSSSKINETINGAIGEFYEQINDFTISQTGENILNPEFISFDDWYYSTSDGESIVSRPGTIRINTVEKTRLPKATNKVYVTLDTTVTPTTYAVMIYSYDDNGFLGAFSRTIDKLVSIPVDVVEGATQIRLYCNEDRDPNIRFCVTLEPVTEFKEYGEKMLINPDMLPENLNRELPFAGQIIINFGDSIYGGKRPPNDVSTFLAKKTGATVYNCGFGGCRMAQHESTVWDAFSMYRLADSIASSNYTLQENAITNDTHNELPSYFSETVALLKTLDFNNVDIITIGYGINDHSKENVLDSAENPKDVATFAGALRYSIEKICGTFPNLKVFICGQTYRAWLNADNTFDEDSDTKLNEVGVKLTEFVAKTEEVAKEYKLPFIDNYYELGINKFNRSHWFPATDGVHHNVLGAELIAEHIAKELF